MASSDLKKRTKDFARIIIGFCRELPSSTEARVISKQLIRSATSVGANYRSACRGKSRADFKSKMGTVLEETDESLYWLELIQETNIVSSEKTKPLIDEANELVAIFTTSINTLRTNRKIKIPTSYFLLLTSNF